LSKDGIDELRVECLYISRNNTSRDVKIKYLGIKNEAAFSPDNIRLWKIKATSSPEAFKKYLYENLDEILETCKKFECDEISYLDYNLEASLKELELAEDDICLLECISDFSPALFEVKEIKTKNGSCEWCRDRKVLRFSCTCEDVRIY
jgi:hypothetical protein